MTIGTVSFQAFDKSDIFYVVQLREEGVEPSDEILLKLIDPQFQGDKAWITGYCPRMRAVHIDGDTSVINAWFKAESFDKPFTLRVYVECELAEEFEEIKTVEVKSRENKKGSASDLEPMEIHL